MILSNHFDPLDSIYLNFVILSYELWMMKLVVHVSFVLEDEKEEEPKIQH